MASPRLLIIGLDGASHTLMRAWMADGGLPAFAAFARDAWVAPLRCTWPPHTATGWASLFAGRLPGQHGIFQFWDCQARDYQLHATPRQALGCAGLWDELAAAGWSLGLSNIPMSHPPGPWPGYQMTWPLVPTLHYLTPRLLHRDIAEVDGLGQPDIACLYDGTPGYPERAIAYIRARTRTVLHLMHKRPTDAVAVVYPEVDRVCHHWYHALDPCHPEAGRAGPADPLVIMAIYAELDAAFAALVQAVPEDCLVVVVSDHGFGPAHRGVRIHRLLEAGGFCSIRGSAEPDRRAQVTADVHGRADLARDMDWSRTAFYMPAPGCFAINVNLCGRQVHGSVGHERAARIAEVTDYLASVTDPDTGAPAFAAVVEGTRAYAGPFADRAPDLVIVPRDPSLYLLQDLDGPTWDKPGQTGTHRMEGIYMMRGPRVAARAHDAVAIESVAGRILASLGRVPDVVPNVDEQADRAMLRAGIPATAWSDRANDWNPPQFNPLARTAFAISDEPSGRAQEAFGDPRPVLDAREVAERMRKLGYW